MISDQLQLVLGRFWLIWMTLSSDGWFRVIADVFGWMVLDGCGWFWVLADGYRWIQGGLQRFVVLVATVKFVALNLKEVDNCEKFL